MDEFAAAYGDDLRAFVERLLRFDTTGGNERPAQDWLEGRLADFGFETYRWDVDADALADHPSFADGLDDVRVDDRPSVAGVVELGDPDDGPTLVLNGHVDVVPADPERWSADPFEPTWDGDRLTARGAADMKSGLAACVFAARTLADADAGDLDGRVVVESVAGEEEGGLGAATATLADPYPFERDAAVVAEPTELTPVVACEGSLMVRIRISGRSAHAATRWRGESVLPHFETVRQALADFEAERQESVTHPLYDEFPVAWPVNVGVVNAGSWASSVPDALTAEVRVGVAPGETVDEVEAALRDHLRDAVGDDGWLAAHPPDVERFSVQFEPSEVDPSEPVVEAVRDAMAGRGLPDASPRGATYGADARHYVDAGIPTVVFGPGSVDQAHFPDETVDWGEVVTAGATLAAAARRFLSS